MLVLDGHKIHSKNIELIHYAKNSIRMLSLPPHTSHKLQPLDRTFFKSLKAAFSVSYASWMRSHPAWRITVHTLGELFTAAYVKAATHENAVNGFCHTGIVPLNKDILPESNFLLNLRTAAEKDSKSAEKELVDMQLENANKVYNCAHNHQTHLPQVFVLWTHIF